MRLFFAALLVFVVAGCTKHNPESCSQGKCTDLALPFCDVDGSIGGEPLTCVAVSCTAGESAGCRGDVELKCNGTGNNYDLVDCPSGCNPDTGRCRTCTSSEQCTNPSPVCDVSGECRACQTDDECPSAVCDGGSCAAEANIIYAMSGGSESSDCLRAQPCSMSRAITVSLAGANARTIRMLPGGYVTSIGVSTASSAPIKIVGTGALLTSFDGIFVTNGGNVEIRGLTSTGGNFAARCGETNKPRSRLNLRDVVLFAGSSSANLMTLANCDASLTNVEFNLNDSTGSALSFGSGILVADRVRFHGQQPSAIGGFGSAVSATFTNSIFEDVFLLFVTNDPNPPGSIVRFGFNTFVLKSQPLDCTSTAANLTVLFEDNVVTGPASFSSVINGPHCTFTKNILVPGAAAPSGNLVADSQFVDSANRDFRLKPTSPAVGAALAAPTIFTDHAFDGAARPQGGGLDIGAYEQ